MAQSGFTPILLYASGTPTNVPSAGNLTSSAAGAELALNYADGKLFYKDSGGVVQTLATKGTGSIGGSTTQVQYNNAGALAGSANLTFDGTALTLGGNPTLSAGTANGVLYLNGSKVATSGSSLTFDGTTFSVLGPITLSNNLGFISTAQRITGDMSSATIANRLAFQTSITNGNTSLIAIPNGTSTTCQVAAVNNSDPTNSSIGSIFITSTEVRVQSARLGTGTFLPLAFYTNSAEQARIDTSGNFLIGTTSNGADGLGISNLLNLTFPEGSGTSYVNLFRQTSSAATILANGYKRSATASGFASSIGTSWAKTAIGLGVGTGDITFYADAAGTVANGTDVTPTERARITSGGKWLVNSNSNAFPGIELVRSTVAADEAISVWNDTTTGDGNFIKFYTDAGVGRGSIDYNRAGGLTRYNTTSDYRAKDIIGPVQNPGATIDALKVYEGKMKGATQTRPMLVAHEAQEVTPYAVSGVKDEVNEDGSPKFQQIDVSSLVPLLLAELQSLRARVAQLERH